MSHLLGPERSLRQQCRRGRLPVRPAVPDRHGEQASYAGISLPLIFVGGISIPPDYARTRSQSRQVKRRVVIDQPSRTKYYTGCPVLHCGHVPYLEWLSTAPSKTNLVFAIRLAQQALPSRSARASPREVYAAPRRPQDPPLRPPQRC